MEKKNFISEKSLQEFLGKKIDFFSSNPKNFMFRREVPIGKCIPDFLLVDFGKTEYKRLSANLSYRDAFLFWNIVSRGNANVNSLVSDLFESESFISSSISKMVKVGLIKKMADGSLSVVLKTRRMNIIAIETKLRNWKEALSQAQDYMRFSNEAIVVIDDEAIVGATKVAYKAAGIGLCGATKNGLKWYVKSKQNKGVTTPDREYIILNSLKSKGYKLWSLQN